MSHSRDPAVAPPLRILTIDNGGLQALSILRIISEVCKVLSGPDGSPRKAPHELFDIIAGIGTGGWLAVLLGRYKLDIDQCMLAYITLANAISPQRKRSDASKAQTDSFALSQETLVDEVEKMIATYDLDRFMMDESAADPSATTANSCHAFAVGVVKAGTEVAIPQYRLFRTYQKPHKAQCNGPDPRTCEVSRVCAATAAAWELLPECKLDDTSYWDNTFPFTHNVSDLALDEAAVLFENKRPLGLLLNVSPGLPTANELRNLRKAVEWNSTKTARARYGLIRIRSHFDTTFLKKDPPPQRSKTDPNPIRPGPTRTGTWASVKSTSSTASKAEEGHQKAIRERLHHEYSHDGGEDLYCRLAVRPKDPKEDKPYLDDVHRPERAKEVIAEFLDLDETKEIMGRSDSVA